MESVMGKLSVFVPLLQDFCSATRECRRCWHRKIDKQDVFFPDCPFLLKFWPPQFPLDYNQKRECFNVGLSHHTSKARYLFFGKSGIGKPSRDGFSADNVAAFLFQPWKHSEVFVRGELKRPVARSLQTDGEFLFGLCSIQTSFCQPCADRKSCMHGLMKFGHGDFC